MFGDRFTIQPNFRLLHHRFEFNKNPFVFPLRTWFKVFFIPTNANPWLYYYLRFNFSSMWQGYRLPLAKYIISLNG